MFEISGALLALLITTFVVAATHSLSPDHWFGFVMLGRSKKWGIPKTLGVASIAGIGHVGTSVVLGLLAVWAGETLAKSYASRFEMATGWLLVVFGFAFALYAWRKGGHSHHGIPLVNRLFHINAKESEKLMHIHADGAEHDHGEHGHDDHDDDHEDEHHHEHENGCACGHDDDDDDHDHDHDEHGHGHDDDDDDDDHDHDKEHKKKRKSIDPGYGLVAIIGLTPCILLIPLALDALPFGMNAVVAVMVVFFIGTMAAILTFTGLALKGLQLIKMEFFEKYGEVITGVIIGILGTLVVAGLI